MTRTQKYLGKMPSLTDIARIPMMKYPYKTGDLILTSTEYSKGLVTIMSNLNKVACASLYNHVGIVYVDPQTYQPYIWEIVGGGVVRLLPIHDIPKETYPQRYFIRSLCNSTTSDTKMAQIIRYQWKFIMNYNVEQSWFARFVPGIDFGNSISWYNDQLRFCSHFVAECYEMLGVMAFKETGVSAREIFPNDFIADLNNGNNENVIRLPWVNGTHLSPIIELV